MTSTARLMSVAFVAFALTGISCELPFGSGGSEGSRPVEVVEATLGRGLRPDKTIPARRRTSEYRPDDTVYLALRLYGAGTEVGLTVRWYFGERLLEQTTRNVAPDGLSRTSFDYDMPGGMVAGRYQVVVLLDGKEVERIAFDVRAARS